MKNALIFLGGLITGAAAGYFVARKVYIKAKEEEIASVEAAFKERYSEQSKEAAPVKAEEPKKEEKPAELKAHDYPKEDYTRYSKETEKYTSDEQVVADMERAVRNRGFVEPMKAFVGRIVTKDEFLDNAEDYGQEILTYYEGDKTLADSNNDIFEETEYLPKDFTQHFDDDIIDKRYVSDVVYVVNDDLEMGYEISRDPRCFKDVVQILE